MIPQEEEISEYHQSNVITNEEQIYQENAWNLLQKICNENTNPDLKTQLLSILYKGNDLFYRQYEKEEE